MTVEAVAEATEAARPTVRIEMVPPVGLDDLWSLVEPMLEPLFEEYPLENLEDVLDSLRMTHRQLWLVLRDGEIAAAVITQIVPFPRARVLEVVALVGEGVIEMLPAIDEHLTEVARQRACSIVQVIGRYGWGKPLKRVGAERVATMYRKVVA